MKGEPVWGMSERQLDAMAAEFDREFVADTFGPMPRRVAERVARAKRKRGRPRAGEGAARISLTGERGLLRRADALAKRLGMKRAQVIDLGFRVLLGMKRAQVVALG